MKVRQNGRIVSVPLIVADGVNSDGRPRFSAGISGPSETETFWMAFLRKLARRGACAASSSLCSTHEGIKATVAKVLNASWAALSHPLHAQCVGPCRQERPSRSLRLHRPRLCVPAK